MAITADGHGEIAFGALQASLDIEYSPYHYQSASTGTARTREIKSLATAPPNCSTTAPSKSSSPTEMATKPYSKPNATLLQQPARRVARPRHLTKVAAEGARPIAVSESVDFGYRAPTLSGQGGLN
jgi:hypothetical protein